MMTLETVLLLLLVVVPYSIYRQMQVNAVDAGGLIKLPLIFIAIARAGVDLRIVEAGCSRATAEAARRAHRVPTSAPRSPCS